MPCLSQPRLAPPNPKRDTPSRGRLPALPNLNLPSRAEPCHEAQRTFIRRPELAGPDPGTNLLFPWYASPRLASARSAEQRPTIPNPENLGAPGQRGWPTASDRCIPCEIAPRVAPAGTRPRPNVPSPDLPVLTQSVRCITVMPSPRLARPGPALPCRVTPGHEPIIRLAMPGRTWPSHAVPARTMMLSCRILPGAPCFARPELARTCRSMPCGKPNV